MSLTILMAPNLFILICVIIFKVQQVYISSHYYSSLYKLFRAKVFLVLDWME